MRHGRLTITLLLSFWAFGLAWVTCAHHVAPAQGAKATVQSTSVQEDGTARQLQGGSPAAVRLAHERGEMLLAIQAKLPDFHLAYFFTHDTGILFPIGRSDRAYILNCGSDSGDYVACYQRLGTKAYLVYRVPLGPSDWEETTFRS